MLARRITGRSRRGTSLRRGSSARADQLFVLLTRNRSGNRGWVVEARPYGISLSMAAAVLLAIPAFARFDRFEACNVLVREFLESFLGEMAGCAFDTLEYDDK